jgi:signal transduction histidine kinase
VSKYEYGYNSIGFVFAGSSFLNEKKIVYKYMLEGYDQKWSEPVTTNTVNYASLAPGRYTFRVMAANSRGLWSESPATFTFQIILPFYRSPWFIFTCIAIAVSLFYLVRVDRLKQKYRVEKIRMRIARDLHDDIGSALGSINLMSETANRRLEKNTGTAEVAGVFTRIGHSAQSTLESMDDIIWSINPDKDKLGDLVVRMREFAIPLLEAKEIAFDFRVNAADYKKLPMHLRKNVFLIFKEAIFNIIKHASCTRVLIVTEIRNNVFCLRVKDNGRGFDTNQPTQRNGLKNMRKRSEMVGGTLNMETQPRKGTTIEFSCVIK